MFGRSWLVVVLFSFLFGSGGRSLLDLLNGWSIITSHLGKKSVGATVFVWWKHPQLMSVLGFDLYEWDKVSWVHCKPDMINECSHVGYFQFGYVVWFGLLLH